MKLLESRLDNLVYRLGFAPTRRAARQLVNHGHITVNGKKVDIPSYQVKTGDIISVKESAKEHPVIKNTLETTTKRVDFVTYDAAKMEGTYVRYPERSELNADINEALIVEFYNNIVHFFSSLFLKVLKSTERGRKKRTFLLKIL